MLIWVTYGESSEGRHSGKENERRMVVHIELL